MTKRNSHSIKSILFFLLLWLPSSFCYAQNLDDKKIESGGDFIQAQQVLDSIDEYGRGDYFSSNKKVIEYSLRVIEWTSQKGSPNEVITTKSVLLGIYLRFNMHLEAIDLAKEILTCPEVENSRILVKTLFALKELYRKLERFDDYLKILPVYYDASEKLGDMTGGAENYETEIAYVHFSLKNYEKAIASYKKSAQNFKQKKLSLPESSSFNNIGLCFRNLKENDSAHYYFKKGVNVLNDFQSNSKKEDRYIDYFRTILEANAAEVSPVDIGDEVMISLYKKEVTDAKFFNEINIVIDGYYGLAKVYFSQKNLEKTFKYLDSTESHLKYYTYPKAKINTLILKMEAHLLKEESEKANASFKAYRSYSDSLNQVKIDKSFMNGVLKHETDLKEKELEEVKEVIKSERKVILYQKIGLVSLFVLFVIFVFVFFKMKRDNKTIQQQKIAVDKALIENKVLVKEVHHRVKNNLQMISSLLRIQSKKKDFNSEETLAQSQAQIESMSLVHEMLYQKENIIDVHAETYIKKLTTSLFSTHPNKKIQLAISIGDITLNLDYANPLGLIITELITNSIKHGFKDLNEGQISINMHKVNRTYEFVYSDSGAGIKEGEEIQKTRKTFGIRLITSLVEEMNGTLEIESSKNLTYNITFLDTNT